MMANIGRFRSIFLLILIITVVWSFVILLCLQQQQQQQLDILEEQLNSSNGNRNKIFQKSIPDLANYFHAKQNKAISVADTLFYEFNPDSNYYSNSETSIPKDKHEEATLELGKVLNSLDKYVKNEGYNLFAFNQLVSNRIGLFRALPDTRQAKCRNDEVQTSHSELKLRTSIVICYYNEAPSALLRTIYTILKRTPPHLMKEILVIDDFSDKEYHYNKIKPFIGSSLVKIKRTSKREGLIRARLFGASLAKGDVLIFLDSHVEANEGWLEPLLQAIQKNRTTIACPMIDLINADTLIYSSSPMVQGGLNWSLNFKWDSVPSEKLKTYDDFIKPIDSPTLAGGLYAVDRSYFYQLGEYDSGMELWGGENVELSLRAWMCGGRIVILPCSRMGHIFRKKRPYGPKPNQPDSLLYNSHRTAKVWLDEYLEKFYEAYPDAKYLDTGDISYRLKLKQSLNCRNFSWFLDNIYPSLRVHSDVDQSNDGSKRDLFKLSKRRRNLVSNWKPGNKLITRQQRQVPSFNEEEANSKSNSIPFATNFHQPKQISQFQIQSLDSKYCIESKESYFGRGFKRLILNECANLEKDESNNRTLSNQLWTETELHDYRIGDSHCLDLIKNLPLLRKCHYLGSFQHWSHENNTRDTSIYNFDGELCLGVEKVQVNEPIIVTICDKKNMVDDMNLRLKQANGRRKVFHFDRRQSNFHHTKDRFSSVTGSFKPSQRWNLIHSKRSE